MMKKIMAACLAVMLCACGSGNNGKPAHTPVTIVNPVELETMTAAMGEYEFLEDDDPAFTEITLAESIRMFKEKGTGILYYGRVGCWWCQRAVPVLNEAAKEMGVTVYYIDVQLPTTEAAYNELDSLINSIFEKDASTGKPVFKVPEVIGVKDGEIVGHHLSLVSSFEPDGDDTMMTDEQKAELKEIYEDIIAAVAE
ncbi:MAG: hypothetical protein IJ130_09695 [Solobacterium sp.]|nr:hypothetical protein [Erysipelotrichaceae bacterium]MBQ9154076.1 hypothetical protein [Solobacterium sp.]